MIILLNVILLLLIGVIIYILLEAILNAKLNEKISNYIKVKNERYYKDLVKYYSKNQKVKLTSKLNITYKLNILIDKSGLKRGLVLNPISLIIFSVISVLTAFFIAYSIMKVIILSVIISLPAILFPCAILEAVKNHNARILEKIMLDFILQLKNYTKINNDIIYAFKQVKTAEPLQSYINTFLIEVNSGIKFEKAIDKIKEKISFDSLKTFFSNIQYCHLYGGDFSKLMNKSYILISSIQKEKSQRVQETKNARIVLVILIALDLFIYFSFIKDNFENYQIMTKHLLGTLILYWNFISIWILLFLMQKVKKLEY